MSVAPIPGVPPSAYNQASGRRPQPDGDLDPADLVRQLRNGASVADVAAAKGVTAAKIIDAVSTLMLPGADLNGDVPVRLSLRHTELVHHRTRPHPHPAPAPPAAHPAVEPHHDPVPATEKARDRPPPAAPPSGPAPRGAGPTAVDPASALWHAANEEEPGGTGGSLNTYA